MNNISFEQIQEICDNTEKEKLIKYWGGLPTMNMFHDQEKYKIHDHKINNNIYVYVVDAEEAKVRGLEETMIVYDNDDDPEIPRSE